MSCGEHSVLLLLRALCAARQARRQRRQVQVGFFGRTIKVSSMQARANGRMAC
jgi:hypothetical protein